MPESNLKQGWRHNQKKNIFWKLTLKLRPVNNNFKKRLLDPFKVHPGLQHPEGPRLQHLQQWNAAGHDKGKGVHTENKEKKTGRGREQTN